MKVKNIDEITIKDNECKFAFSLKIKKGNAVKDATKNKKFPATDFVKIFIKIYYNYEYK